MIPHPRRTAAVAAVVIAATTAASPVLAEGRFTPLSFAYLSVAKPRAVGADFYVDDRDRDPLGIDIFDVGFRFRFQAGEGRKRNEGGVPVNTRGRRCGVGVREA